MWSIHENLKKRQSHWERKWKNKNKKQNKKWEKGKTVKKKKRERWHIESSKRECENLMERRCFCVRVVKSFSLRSCRENFWRKRKPSRPQLIESVCLVGSTCVCVFLSVNERQSVNSHPESGTRKDVCVFSKRFYEYL